MVTIEQKLTLFSKLLNQDIKEEASVKLDELEKEYEKRLAENKFQVDKEAKEIIEQARKRAELRKVELISKGRLSSKKEMMQIKEELIERFMKSLEEKVKAFTEGPDYVTYLDKVLDGLSGLKDYQNQLIIYLTTNDLAKNKDFITKKLMSIGINKNLLSFEEEKGNILGGLIIKDPVLNMRVDESIRTLIDETKDEIVEKITLAVEEEGDVENE